MEGVKEILEKGKKLNFFRCLEQPKPVARPKIEHRKFSKVKDFRIYKIQYPETPKYRKCQHQKDFTLNRNFMTSKERLTLLAHPPKRRLMKYNPCWTLKRITPASIRLNELAMPRFPKVTETFSDHLHHMDIFLIENFLNKIYGNEYQTPEEAMTVVRQKLRDRQHRIRRKKKEAKKLRKKMCAKRTNVARIYSNYVNQYFRAYIMSDQQVSLTGDAAKYSNSILNKLCRLMKQKVPQRDSCDLFGQILCKFADQISNWVINFVENSDFKWKAQESCNFVKECVSIEDYYPHEEVYPQAASAECPKESPENEKEIKCKDLDEDAMSFLSHVDVDPAECQALFEKIKRYRQERLDKLAADERRKLFMAAKRAAAAAARALRGFGDDEEEEGDDQECYGDINEKPQWQVTWVDKSNAP